jgi:hypothetical protein
MGSDINIKETIEDKQSWFNIKRFTIGDTDFEKPEKSLDVKNLDNLAYRNVKGNFKFFEATKIIKKYDNILNIYNADETQVRNFFYKGEWLGSARNVINFTLEFNPYNYVKSVGDISWFFDQYYPYSKLFLTVPNIRLKRVGEDKKTVHIIDIDGYKKFVDETYKILNDKNGKKIFVPISTRFTLKQLDELIEHYLKHEHYNFWFDFEGRSISEDTLGRLRHIFNTLKKKEAYDKVVSYFTNIKREKLANSNEAISVASDALSAVAGANLVGVNREPMMYFDPPPAKNGDSGEKENDTTIRTQTPVDPNHKARIFDRDTYYYVKTDNPDLHKKSKYTTLNAAKLNAEFCAETEYFLEHHDIASLLNEKRMFKDEKAGNILSYLTSKSRDKKEDGVTDFL